MPSNHRFGYPEDWEQEAENFLSDTELAGFDAPQQPKFPDTLFVHGLPNVDSDELLNKLKATLKKRFGKESGAPGFEIDMRLGADFAGIAFIKCNNPKDVQDLQAKIEGYKLGKNFLGCCPVDDIDSIKETPEAFHYTPKNTGLGPLDDCKEWLLDDKGREQILLRFQQETEIHWLDPLLNIVPFYCGEREKEKGKVWCDWKVMWSSHGNFLVTCHRPGVCLWGGENMVQKRKFIHAEVQNLLFSPNEEYLMTWNGNGKEDPKAYKIWEVTTGKLLREVPTPFVSPSGVTAHDVEFCGFPHMVFSPDSKYMAKCSQTEVQIYDLPAVQRKEGGVFSFDNGVQHFKFSPKDNIVAVWSPQGTHNPSSLTVINVDSGDKLQTRTKNNFHASLEWQSEGDYLCAVLTRRGKMKDGREGRVGKTQNLDILRMREKNVPVEAVDVEEHIKEFSWEPKGHRFALLTEAKESASKGMLVFYSLANNECKQVAQFEVGSNYNKIFWAPEGQYFVVAAMGQGDLMWGRLHPETNVFELLYKDEQVNLNHVEWDSRGRYVLTSVLQPIEQSQQNIAMSQDAGFTLWTFQGRPVHQENIEKLYGASFRPNPPSLLSEEEEKETRKNLKVHSRRFEQIDDEARNKQRREEREKKERKIREFKAVCQTLNTNFLRHAESKGWEEAQRRFKEAHAFVEKTEIIEELIKTEEETIEMYNGGGL